MAALACQAGQQRVRVVVQPGPRPVRRAAHRALLAHAGHTCSGVGWVAGESQATAERKRSGHERHAAQGGQSGY